MNGEELSKFRTEKESIWEIVNRELKRRKLRKFLDVAREGDLIENYIPDSEDYGECDVCKTPDRLYEFSGNKVCPVCKNSTKWEVRYQNLTDLLGLKVQTC
ncbi:hypothetical protein [Archaeoglobus sp.]